MTIADQTDKERLFLGTSLLLELAFAGCGGGNGSPDASPPPVDAGGADAALADTDIRTVQMGRQSGALAEGTVVRCAGVW